MKKTWAIALKELSDYFRSPLAYIILVVTVMIFNIFFFMIIDENREASLRDVFKVIEFMLIFIVPILTMKIFSEEKATGTIEFLMTTPTSNASIVFGKYLGSLLFFSVLFCFTFVYFLIVAHFGQPDRLSMLVGYLGVWLEAALFIAIGLMTSSWTPHQILAAITSYIIIFLLYFATSFIKYANPQFEKIFQNISVLTHSQNLFAGLITLSDLVYYVSGIVFCLVLTRLSIENRFWR